VLVSRVFFTRPGVHYQCNSVFSKRRLRYRCVDSMVDFPLPGPMTDISNQCLVVNTMSFTVRCLSLSHPRSILCQHLGWAQIL